MKRNRICVLIIALFVFPSLCNAIDSKEAVVGTWKLISIERVIGENISRPDYWMGSNPTGVIIYDSTGYMSVQLMRDSRPNFESGDRWITSSEEKKVAFEGYYAYFGTYEVNEKEGFVLHHVQGSLWPNEVGVTYKRMFKISRNRIMLTTPKSIRLTFERVEKVK
jgi:hypothetical protein